MPHATVTKMSEYESIEAMCEGLKKSAHHARELAAKTEDKGWAQIAELLDGMRANGYKLSRMKAMKRSEVMQALDLKQGKHIVNMNPLKSGK